MTFKSILLSAVFVLAGCISVFAGVNIIPYPQSVEMTETVFNKKNLDKVKFVKSEDLFCTYGAEKSLRACASVNVAVNYVLRIAENSARIVSKNDLRLSPRLANERFVVFYVVNTRESMLLVAEKLAVLCKRENVLVRINALFIKSIEAYKMVTNLVRGV